MEEKDVKKGLTAAATRPVQEIVFSEDEVSRHCPVCGEVLIYIKCKMVCRKCGFFIGCSE